MAKHYKKQGDEKVLEKLKLAAAIAALVTKAIELLREILN